MSFLHKLRNIQLRNIQKILLATVATASIYSCSGEEGSSSAKNPATTLDVLIASDTSDYLSNDPSKDSLNPEAQKYGSYDSVAKSSKSLFNYCANGLPPPTWLVDEDQDGYFAKATVACVPPNDGKVYISAEDLQAKTGQELPLLDCEGWDNNAAVHPYATDICDELDNDCDLQVDEDQPSIAKSCSGGAFDFCERLQFQYCFNGKLSEWSPCVKVTIEEYCDGKDNDCNGTVDDIKPEECTTACGTGIEACLNGAITCDYLQEDPNCCEPIGAIKDKQPCPPTHYVFVVDASASTSEATAAVKDALTQFAESHKNNQVAGELGMILFRELVEETPYGLANDEGDFKQWVKSYVNISSKEGHLNALMNVADDFPWPDSGKYHAILVSDSHFDEVDGGSFNPATPFTLEETRNALVDKGIYLSAVQVYGYSQFYISLEQYDALTEGIGQHLKAQEDETIVSSIMSLLKLNNYSYYICNKENKWEFVDECGE